MVPLSPNWKLSGTGIGVRLVPESGRVRFEIVQRETDHSPGTVKGGDGLCPFPGCRRTIDGDEIKATGQGRTDGAPTLLRRLQRTANQGLFEERKGQDREGSRLSVARPEDDIEALVCGN